MKRHDIFTIHAAPFYAYRKQVILRQAQKLKQVFPDFEILYSIKTNPFFPILQTISEFGLGADAASAKEVSESRRAGIPSERIYFSAPGKTRDELEDVIGRCHIIADSFHELDLCNRLAQEKHAVLPIGIRINPAFSMEGTEGGPSQFGIDEEQLLSSHAFDDFPALRPTGIHVHIQSQILDADQLTAYYAHVLTLALRLEHLWDTKFSYINFGSGLGIVYDPDTQKPLDLDALQRKISTVFDAFRPRLQAKFLLESGRFLVGESGVYVTEIMDIKISRGKTYYIVKNGTNGFFRPVMKELMTKDQYTPAPAEPFYTCPNISQVTLLADREGTETVDIVGGLCSRYDLLASNVTLPRAEVGDRLLFTNAGSYGYTLSPLLFGSQTPPDQLWLEHEIDI